MTNIFEVQNGSGYTLVRLFGEIDAAIVQKIKPVLLEKIPATCSRVVIDLTKVEFLDSHGVGLFVSLLKRAHTNGGKLIFAGAEGQPASVLRMVGFDGPHSSFCDNAEAACANG